MKKAHGNRKTRVTDNEIRFYRYVDLEIHSVNDDWINEIEKNVVVNGIRILNRRLYVDFIRKSKAASLGESLHFTTGSPITVNTTNPQTKETRYYSPAERKFNILVNTNLSNKYKAYYGHDVEDGIQISFVGSGEPHRYVTQYKDFYIEAWLGKFLLEGPPSCLSFLYETGIGARNSCGFGLMRVNHW